MAGVQGGMLGRRCLALPARRQCQSPFHTWQLEEIWRDQSLPHYPPVMTKADSKASAGLELSLAESCEILEFSAWKAQPFPGLLLPPRRPPLHLKSALGLIGWSLW